MRQLEVPDMRDASQLRLVILMPDVGMAMVPWLLSRWPEGTKNDARRADSKVKGASENKFTRNDLGKASHALRVVCRSRQRLSPHTPQTLPRGVFWPLWASNVVPHWDEVSCETIPSSR